MRIEYSLKIQNPWDEREKKVLWCGGSIAVWSCQLAAFQWRRNFNFDSSSATMSNWHNVPHSKTKHVMQTTIQLINLTILIDSIIYLCLNFSFFSPALHCLIFAIVFKHDPCFPLIKIVWAKYFRICTLILDRAKSIQAKL